MTKTDKLHVFGFKILSECLTLLKVMLKHKITMADLESYLEHYNQQQPPPPGEKETIVTAKRPPAARRKKSP
ncbi:hypothetical protein ES702_06412 [subsurface metagenome]